MLPSGSLFTGQSPVGELRERLPSLASSVRILVVGDVMLDRYWFGDVSRISPEAPVPIVRITGSDDRLGGAANVARNVAALGARVSLIGQVGDDEAGHCVRRLLERDGIEPQLQVSAACPTIVKLRVLSRRQQMLRIDFDAAPPGCGAALLTDGALALMQAHDAIVLSDYAKGGLRDARHWIAMARALGRPVLVDPKARDFSAYAGASVLKPNASELRRAAGDWSDDARLQAIAESMCASLNIGALLVTRSEQGMSLFDSDGVQHFSAEVREVFDVSGAGDTVIAVMATLLAAGVDLRCAAWLANRAAGLAVARIGTTAITIDELLSSLH